MPPLRFWLGIAANVMVCATLVIVKLLSTVGAGLKLPFPSWEALNVATPCAKIVTVPLASTVALFVSRLVKLTGNPELALASKLKLAESTVLFGIVANVMF